MPEFFLQRMLRKSRVPSDWRRITVNLLHCQNRAELFISPDKCWVEGLPLQNAVVAAPSNVAVPCAPQVAGCCC